MENNMGDKGNQEHHGDMHWEHHNGYGHWHGRFWLMRVFVMLAALLFVFWLGVKVGEIKEFYRGSYGGFYGMHGMRTMGVWNENVPPTPYNNMMWGWWGTPPTATTTPSKK